MKRFCCFFSGCQLVCAQDIYKHLSLGCFFFFSLNKSLVCSFQYTVHHLTITNRGDCCHERLSNFEIRIGNFQANNTNQNPQCGGYYSLGAGETKKIVCPAQMKGRYVVIRIPGNNKTLTLCEVEVYVEYIGKCGED